MGGKKTRIPVYELAHQTLNVWLANQTQVTITECLKDVDVEFQGHWIQVDLWIHHDSDTEDISLGKDAMQRLGFALTDPARQNTWMAKDPLKDDPQVAALMTQLFGHRASNGVMHGKSSGTGTEEPIV